VTARNGWGYASDEIKLNFSRHLRGEGVELGPGHHPYVTVLPGTSVRYIDRWETEENRALFPELGETAEFPKPDIVANLDSERLEMLEDASQDFVVASHIFEHVANPLALLMECHRVLTPGGILLLLLPDMTRTSDGVRRPTTLDHLIAELDADIREVDDEHVIDYLRVVRKLDPEAPGFAERVENEKARSIHAHCWTEETFFPVLRHAAAWLDCPFEIVELLMTGDINGGKEFGYILRRPTVEVSAAENEARLVATRDLLVKTRFAHSDPALKRPAPGARPPRHPALRAARKAQRKVQANARKVQAKVSSSELVQRPLAAAGEAAAKIRSR
jgi:SAM-dependent methyltransferase